MADPIIDMFDKGGWVLVGIVIVSAIAWSLIVSEWLSLLARTGRDWSWAQRTVDDLQSHTNTVLDGNESPSFMVHSSEGCFIGRLLRSPLMAKRIERSSFDAQVAPFLESEVVAFERTIQMVGVLAAVLPLLGLLGTVQGMIQTFDVLTEQGVAQVDAMAGGISHALITTQAGLVIAVPILLVNRYLGARIRKYLELSRVMLKKIETAICVDNTDSRKLEAYATEAYGTLSAMVGGTA